MEVVASLSQGRTAAAQCGLFANKSVPVIFETPCSWFFLYYFTYIDDALSNSNQISKRTLNFPRIRRCSGVEYCMLLGVFQICE